MSKRKPTVYTAVYSANPVSGGAWGIKGGWKTVNSSMGFYPSKQAAEEAIARMVVTREQRTIRKVPRAGS